MLQVYLRPHRSSRRMYVYSHIVKPHLSTYPSPHIDFIVGSSYAPSERFKRKWIRIIKRVLPGGRKSQLNVDSWVEPGLTGQLQQNANKLLAAIGHNEWIPKLPGQLGLRVLCLDGGGTRGIAAVTSLRHLVKAMDGVEVCDAFDMIVGTSTGAIVAFLVGLRRER